MTVPFTIRSSVYPLGGIAEEIGIPDLSDNPLQLSGFFSPPKARATPADSSVRSMSRRP